MPPKSPVSLRSALLLALACLPLLACSLFSSLLPSAALTPSGDPPAVETGAPVAVTSAASPPVSATPPAPAALPTVAAEGLVVVYVRDGNLWRWSPDGPVQLTTAGEVYTPLISPDGRMAAFLRPADEFHLEIWAVNLDGTQERRLVGVADLDTIGGGVRDPSAVAVNPYQLAWVPGSGALAFNTHQVFQGPGTALLNDLNLVDPATGKVTNLLLSGWGGMFTYSPDGKQIAIVQPEKLFLTGADGANYRLALEHPAVNTYSEARFYARPYWLPDSSALRVAIPPADPLAAPAQPTALWTIPADGGAPRQDGQLLTVPFIDQPVSYSPDAQRVAYLSPTGAPAENRRELHLAAYDGGGDWSFASAPLLQFSAWSPDGQRFAYVLGENGEAWWGGLQNGPAPLDGVPAGIARLRWIDGRRFLVASRQIASFELLLGAVDSQPIVLDALLDSPFAFDFWQPVP